MNNIFWSAYNGKKRSIAILEIQSIRSKYGSIVDFKQFSDISLSFVIEIEELKINTLYSALTNHIKLDNFLLVESNSKRERVIFLNITFAAGSGYLKIETPAIPG